MLTEKLMETVKRQSELAKKVMDGTATDEEKAELDKINQAIDTATGQSTETRKTDLVTMKLEEFQNMVEEKTKSDISPDELALLKRNIESVKKQGKTKADDIVAVEVLVKQSAEDMIAALENRVVELEAKLEAKLAKKPSEPEKAADKPTAQALASEAIDSIIEQFGEMKNKITAGTLKQQDVKDMWPSWQMQELIEGATAVVAKLDEAKKLIKEVMPELKKLSEGGEVTGDGDGDEEDHEEEESSSTSQKTEKWWSKGDLAGEPEDAQKQFSNLKKKKESGSVNS